MDAQRVGVHFLARRIEEGDDDPETLANEFDLNLADVSLALAYSHNPPRKCARSSAEDSERERR